MKRKVLTKGDCLYYMIESPYVPANLIDSDDYEIRRSGDLIIIRTEIKGRWLLTGLLIAWTGVLSCREGIIPSLF